jgi:glycosyltransferase involved in cell wall biosynthesis
MPCVDSHPPQPDWVKDYKQSDYILGYSWYAKRILEMEGVKCWHVTNPGVDTEVFNTNKSRAEALQRWGFRKDVKPILGVFRNQKRKLLPEMVYSYLILKNKYPEAYKNSVLWLHTSWPDVGFNIPLIMRWAKEGRIPVSDAKGRIKEKKFKIPLKYADVVFSYVCHKCGHAFVSTYVDGVAEVRNLETGEVRHEKTTCDLIRCQKCGEKAARMPNTQKGFYPEDFADVYRAAWVHVQPAIAGADEMPTNEAKACGTPILAPTHAAMQEKVEKTDFCPDDRWKGGLPIDIASMFTEAETMQQRCYFDKFSLAKQLNKVLSDPVLRDKLGDEAAEVAKKYYDWDDIAKTWDDFLWETVEVKVGEKSWDAPAQIIDYGDFSVPTPDQMDDERFVKWCYSHFLNVTEPDTQGFNNWMVDIQRGRSREDIVNFFKSQADEKNNKELIRTGKQPQKNTITLSDYLDKEDTFRILVVMPGTAGDLHLLTGVLKSLYKKFRRSDKWGLYVACEPKFNDILSGLPFIKNLIPYGNNLDNGKAVEKSGLFNICYTPHIITQRFEHYVHNGFGKHLIQAYADMCGVETETPEITTIPIGGLPSQFYVLHAKTSMKSKDWPLQRFKSLARLFPNEQFVQVGGPNDPAINEPNVIDLRGKTTFKQMAYVIRKSDGIVGLDSIALHLASTEVLL